MSEQTIEATKIYYAWDTWLQSATYVLVVRLENGDEYHRSGMSYEGALEYGRAYTGRETTDDPEFGMYFAYLLDEGENFPIKKAVWCRTVDNGSLEGNRMPSSSDERSFDITAMDEWLKDDVCYAVLRWDTFVAHEITPSERKAMAHPTVANMRKYLEMKGRLRPFLEHEMSAFIEDVLAGELFFPRPTEQLHYTHPLGIPPDIATKFSAYCCEHNQTFEAVVVDLLSDVVKDWEKSPGAKAAFMK